jgi:glucose/arabinose dehydrogenase
MAVPAGFRDELVIGGLDSPTAVQFAADGRIIIAEKRGRIRIYSSATDTNPGVYTGLETNVYNYWDRGMLGMVIDPQFTTGRPYIYVVYTYNHILGDAAAAPRWLNDGCPDPPASTGDGCVASGRIDRLTVDDKTITGSPTKLVEDWCQQFPSHSMGSLAFAGGALYATGGEGASFYTEDFGQLGGTKPNTTSPITPANPCGDPPNPKGTKNTLPTAEGGALRSQDLRTRSTSDPVGLNGTLIRINPDTGAGWPTNSLAGDPDANAKRIIAFGLRNPFRYAIRPGTSEVWIGDVGNFSWEEINVVPDPNAAPRNFGWPCYEGIDPNGNWNALNVNLCESLYSAPAASHTSPAFKYAHDGAVVASDACYMGRGSAIAGMAFLGTASSYPNAYDNGLFFGDYNRRCIWWAPATGTGGTPNFGDVALFANLERDAAGDADGGAVYLGTDRNGDLVYSDFDRGEIRRIRYYGANVPPNASFTATPSSGPLPLHVNFDASGTTDGNPGDPLIYQWDLDGDLAYDDATGKTTSRDYSTKAHVTVGLKVTDTNGAGLSDTTTRTINPGYAMPSAAIDEPISALGWKVGDNIHFSGTAKDGNGASLPPSSMTWTLSMEHCPSDCHSHVITTFPGVQSGDFDAPDHEYPSHLRLKLVVTEEGLSATAIRDIYPATGVMAARSDPPGLPLTLGGKTGAPPPNATAIVGSTVTASAPTTGQLGITQYAFDRWSDGGAAVHGVTTTSTGKSLIAYYRATGPTTVYRPLDPARLLDTRSGNGLGGAFTANVARTFQVTGRGNVPTDAVAVTGNLTVTRQTAAGYVALTPLPTNAPAGSNLNFPVGVDRASLVTATLGPGGKLSAVYVASAGKTTHLVFDVTGYFTASGTTGTYKPLDPVRLLDTRSGNGLSGRFVVGTRRSWQITGRATIPTTATAITANVTVVSPSAAGHVTLYPAGAPTTSTSTLNFKAGESAANGVAIRLGTGGKISAAMSGPAGASTHLLLDVTGYFVNDATGARYVPLFPSRALDTRSGLGLSGPFAANTGRNLGLAGRLGVPSGAVAVNGTLTVTGPTGSGQLSVMTTAANTSSTSTLNFITAETRANGFFGRMASGGSIGILYVGPSGATTQVVLDLAGYFK